MFHVSPVQSLKLSWAKLVKVIPVKHRHVNMVITSLLACFSLKYSLTASMVVDPETCLSQDIWARTVSVSWGFSFRRVLLSAFGLDRVQLFFLHFFSFPAFLVLYHWLLLNQTAVVAQLYPTEKFFSITCAVLHSHLHVDVMSIFHSVTLPLNNQAPSFWDI